MITFVSALLLLLTGATQAPRPVTVDALILAEDRRASRPGDYELIVSAASDRDAAMRARAIRALGRLERNHPADAVPADVIERALADRDAGVRRTAAYALARSAMTFVTDAKATRRAALLARLASERDDVVAGALMEAAARLGDAGSLAQVEAAVIAQATTPARRAAASSALEVASRRNDRPGASRAEAQTWLRAAALDVSLPVTAQRAAAQALVNHRAIDVAFASRAFANPDWQVRRLAVAGAAALPDARAMIDGALRDTDAHVRYEAVRAVARRGADACPALVAAMKDPDAHVSLAAIDALARCTDPAIAASLATTAAVPGGINWHRASHALVSLAALDAARARELAAKHAADSTWGVRMYAAAAAGRVKDDALLSALAADAHPNVREAAITALVERAKDPADQAAVRARLKPAVLAALAERRDPQLLRTAAAAVAATGDAPSFRAPLLAALTAIDEARGETTVDARVAIVEALKLAAPGETPPPPLPALEPATPSIQELRRLPARARIEMARGGVIQLELFPEEAPATVARFARLAQAGYYDGLTFHRVVPNFVIQGGSPWANEYAGAPRFQRDELGFARHERGAVGISTRGRDTGDAQIFIDLVDLPRLNHDYTVFARVVSGMDVVDRILEADVISRVEVTRGR